MPLGKPRNSFPPWEIEQVMTLYKQYREQGLTKVQAYKKIGEIVGRCPQTICTLVVRMTPTTNIAADLIKAKAYYAARRILARGSPSELIDVLSRSNIGVLAPKKEGGGGSGFFISVSADSCGAVKVGVANQEPKALLDEPAPNLFQDFSDENPPVIEADPIPQPEEGKTYSGLSMQYFKEVADAQNEETRRVTVGRSKAFQEAVERAKFKLELARGKK